MAKKQAHIVVKGLVQGVFFRAHTEQAAKRLGLSGWVKNRPDGSVEIKAEGDEEKVKRFVEWCHQGPPSARVTGVDVSYGEVEGRFGSFGIKYY